MRWLALMLAMLPLQAAACGPDSDCVVGPRTYRIAMPEGDSTPGALLFAHGYRGTAAGAMRNGGLRRLANELGVALIAMQGVDGSWDLPGGPGTLTSDGLAEMRYYEAVLDDAEARFGIDRSDVVATGFSAGGMMTWNLLCKRSDLIRGAVPMSGTFWDPLPVACDSPAVSVIHIHGDADRTVPLGGRPIGPTTQGDVPSVLGMYARFGGFAGDGSEDVGAMDCALRENPEGARLGFCLFAGGHSFRLENLRAGYGLLE